MLYSELTLPEIAETLGLPGEVRKAQRKFSKSMIVRDGTKSQMN